MPVDFTAMDGYEFEDYISGLFRQLGFEVEETSYSNSTVDGSVCSLACRLLRRFFPKCFPRLMGFPREVGRSRSARERDGNFAKTCFAVSVGKWSARTGNNPGSLLVFLALWHFDSCAHNPEVVGSSPASATISQASLSSGSEVSFYAPKLMGSHCKHLHEIGLIQPCLADLRKLTGRHLVGKSSARN